MDRIKLIEKAEVNFVEPLKWRETDGSIRPVKKANGSFYVVEYDKQCYMIFPSDEDGRPLINGVLHAIKEKFDDLEGKELDDIFELNENGAVTLRKPKE